MPFILQNRHLHCVRFFPNLNVPSVQAAPNCVPQYLEKPDFVIRSLNPLLSIQMTSRALHSVPRSEETRKTAFPDTNAIVTQDSTHLEKCLLDLVSPRATGPQPGVYPRLPDPPSPQGGRM